MNRIQEWSEDSKRVLALVVGELESLGASVDVLACVGSWGDTLPDEEVAVLLSDAVAKRPLLLKCCEHPDTSEEPAHD